jgi:hypothetical protein
LMAPSMGVFVSVFVSVFVGCLQTVARRVEDRLMFPALHGYRQQYNISEHVGMSCCPSPADTPKCRRVQKRGVV